MAIKTEAIGKEWPATTYQVGKEKIGEYARVLGIDNPVHFDRRGGQGGRLPRRRRAADVLPSSTARPALAPAMFDPEVGMNFAAMVHGGQEFEWGEPACSGDEITTTRQVPGDLREGRQGLLRLRDRTPSTRTATRSSRGTWTNIVRGV